MFRIEVVPYDASKEKQERTILHACLNTCQTDSDRRHKNFIASIGRKNSTITFPNDKCVSRCHAYLSIIHAGDENLTYEEQQACEADCCGVALVLEDQGSKFGTVIVQSTPFPKKSEPNNKHDDDETDDQTDDELSSDNVQINSSKKLELKHDKPLYKNRVQPKTHILLNALSSTNYAQDNQVDDNKSLTTSIQFGVSGSAIHITRIPLSFCFATMDRNVHIPTILELQRIGATYTNSWIISSRRPSGRHPMGWLTDFPPTTHLIAQQFKTSAKFLTAFVSHTPVCTLDYITAMFDRTCMRDDLPLPQNFIPSLSSSANNNTTSTTSALHQSLHEQMIQNSNRGDDYHALPYPLKSYLFIVVADDEVTKLVQAAGALICPTYKFSEAQFYGSPWIQEWEQKAILHSLTPVVLECSSRKIRRRMKFLSMAIEKKKDEVEKGQDNPNQIMFYITNPKEIAQAVTNTNYVLRDSSGCTIQCNQQDSVAKSQYLDCNSNAGTAASSNHENSHKEMLTSEKNLSPLAISLEKGKSSQHTDRKRNTSESGLEQINSELEGQVGEHKRPKKSDSCSKSKRSGKWTTSKNVPSLSQSSTSSKIKQNETKLNHVFPSTQATDSKDVNIEKNESTALISSASNNVQQSFTKTIFEKKTQAKEEKRRCLSKTKDGWFLAAPTDHKLRKQYKRNNFPLQIFATSTDNNSAGNDIGDNFEPVKDNSLENTSSWMLATAADTESRSDLIVRSTQPGRNAPKTKRIHATDFKRFRKNEVIYNSIRPVTIEFVSVLPKESERERQLQLSQEEIEKEQMLADALFAEGINGIKGKRGKGRDTIGGSILQYLSQSPSSTKTAGKVRRRSGRR